MSNRKRQDRSMIKAVLAFRFVVYRVSTSDPWVAVLAGKIAWEGVTIVADGNTDKVCSFRTYAKADKLAQKMNRKRDHKRVVNHDVPIVTKDVPITLWIVRRNPMSALWEAVLDLPGRWEFGKYRGAARAEGECALFPNGEIATYRSRVAAEDYAASKNRPLDERDLNF